MELLLRLYEGNKIKSETSIYQLEYTDEIRNQNSKGILVYKGLELNVLERNVNLNKKQVPFTSKEFEILFFLASYPGQVFTHRQIYEAVWGKEYFRDEGNVTAHIDLNIDRYLKVLLKYWSTTDEQLAELAPWSEKLWSIKNRM